jgi:hypothetical protein
MYHSLLLDARLLVLGHWYIVLQRLYSIAT